MYQSNASPCQYIISLCHRPLSLPLITSNTVSRRVNATIKKQEVPRYSSCCWMRAGYGVVPRCHSCTGSRRNHTWGISMTILIFMYTESGRTLQGSFSAVSKPIVFNQIFVKNLSPRSTECTPLCSCPISSSSRLDDCFNVAIRLLLLAESSSFFLKSGRFCITLGNFKMTLSQKFYRNSPNVQCCRNFRKLAGISLMLPEVDELSAGSKPTKFSR